MMDENKVQQQEKEQALWPTGVYSGITQHWEINEDNLQL